MIVAVTASTLALLLSSTFFIIHNFDFPIWSASLEYGQPIFCSFKDLIYNILTKTALKV